MNIFLPSVKLNIGITKPTADKARTLVLCHCLRQSVQNVLIIKCLFKVLHSLQNGYLTVLKPIVMQKEYGGLHGRIA